MPPKAPTDQQVDTQTRRAFVLKLRAAGVKYRDIAQAAIDKFGLDALPSGYSGWYASQDVQRELAKLKSLNEEQAETIRQLELERLDQLLLGIWGDATSGRLGAIDRVLKLMQRRAELTGIDQLPPQRFQLEDVTGGPDYSELSDDELRALLPDRPDGGTGEPDAGEA